MVRSVEATSIDAMESDCVDSGCNSITTDLHLKGEIGTHLTIHGDSVSNESVVDVDGMSDPSPTIQIQDRRQPLYTSHIDVLLGERYRSLKLMKQFHGMSSDEYTGYQAAQTVQTWMTEGCLVKSCVSGIAGGFLGLLLGTFFFTMRHVDVDPGHTLKQQIRQQMQGFGPSVVNSAKNFSKIGAIYSLMECTVEKGRATHDIYNSIYAGCVTGASLAYKSGPGAMVGGCAGFAAFSAAMDKLQIFSSFE